VKKGMWIGCGLAALVGVVLCGGLIALIASGIWALVAMTQPVADAANDFLSLVGQGKTPEAYASTGSVLRAQNDEASFTAAVKQLGLTDYVSSSWNHRNIENQSGSVEGTVTTKSGTAPAKVELVYEQGKWRVAALHYAGRDLADLMVLQIPADEEQRRLAAEALEDLDQAVQAKDFTAFYAKISEKWRQQTSAQDLQKAFQPLIDKGADLGLAKDVLLQFNPPARINPQGLLVLEGDYQARNAQKMHFKLEYIHEATGWKLFGAFVNS
jgi:hypothetical protein